MIPGLRLPAGLLGAAASSGGGTGNPVTLVNKIASQTNTDGAAATASFTFKTTRTVRDQNNVNLQTWLDSSANPSDYQIRVTTLSGDVLSGDSLGTWLSLSVNRTWTLTDPAAAVGSKLGKVTVEIRDAAAPNTLRASATYTVKADSQASGGGGGGGGSVVNWDDIFGTTSTPGGNASNANQTMDVAGTLSFAYSLDPNSSVSIFKNGSSLGQVASVSVTIGDLVHMRFSVTSMSPFDSRTGTITVSGAVSDVIACEIDGI